MKIGEIENVVYFLMDIGQGSTAASIKEKLDHYERRMYDANYYQSEEYRVEAIEFLAKARSEAKLAIKMYGCVS